MEKTDNPELTKEHTVQVSPNDWERVSETKEFPLTATLGDVRDWVIKKQQSSSNNRIMEHVQIIEPE